MTDQPAKHRRRERRHHAAAAEAAWCAFESAREDQAHRERERTRTCPGVESPPESWWHHRHSGHLTR